MKLPTVTSFFLFFLLILMNSCEIGGISESKNDAEILALSDKAYYEADDKNFKKAIKTTLEMLRLALERNEIESVKKAYDKLARYYFNYKKTDSAIYYTDKLYQVAEKTEDVASMARACHKKGYYFKKLDSFGLALANFADSKSLYLKLGDTIQAGKELLEIVNVQKNEGNFGASELSASEGLKYLKGSNELKSIAGLYLALTSISRETGRIKVANDNIDKGLDLLKDSISVKLIGRKIIGLLRNAKGNTLKDLKRYDEAIDYFNLAFEDYKKNTLETKRTQFNLAHTLYLKNGFNKVSDSLLQDSYAYYVSKDLQPEKFSTLLKLAELYKNVDKNKFSKYINKALESAKIRKMKKSIYEALELKLEVDYTVTDYKRFILLKNELQREKEDVDYFYINDRFNYEASEKENIILENKESKRTQQLLGLSLFLVVLIVLIFFIYQRIKRKHKIEKVKTVHVTEARISTKVHDELANDLYELMSQLETSSPEKETILDKLDVIYNQARDISKQIQSVDTDQKFADELSNLFRSYQSEKVNVLLKRYDMELWKGISSHIKITVYRVLQELLTNMKKHSNAALVVVSIEKKNKKLFIQYIDNGKGFTEEISKNGLQNAENRIRAIKGKLTFDTELHKGCKFSINVPV
ncbi:MAG: sensor histidine kinase [Kordia sp.]|uniref:sensor histidine kinase n=1 Tax=Kordia sp. TaxID=1965332 RepID=UPI00385A2777